MQDAFVKLWGRYSLGSASEAEALLVRTARNASVDAIRRERTVRLDGDLPEEDDTTAEREALFRKVEELMQKDLSELQQYIIRRHEYQGVPLGKVAKELGMEPPAVRMQLSRARKKIRDRYNEQELL